MKKILKDLAPYYGIIILWIGLGFGSYKDKSIAFFFVEIGFWILALVYEIIFYFWRKKKRKEEIISNGGNQTDVKREFYSGKDIAMISSGLIAFFMFIAIVIVIIFYIISNV